MRALLCPLHRENILVLDIFFEALNYEKIEQKKAYEIAGLLGKIPTLTEQAACHTLQIKLHVGVSSLNSQTHYWRLTLFAEDQNN